MTRLLKPISHLPLSFLVALSIVAASDFAQASPVAAGQDVFTTLPGGSQVDLSFILPSVGVINVESNPFDANGADTIIERIQGINPLNVCPTLPCSDTIDIELVALSLVSAAPVDLSDLGGPFIGVFADAYFTVNKGGIIAGLPQPDALNPSIGQMEIIHSNGSGGTFESCLGNPSDPAGVCNTLGVLGGGVYTNGIFTVIGGDPSNPPDVFFSAAAPRLAVSGINGVWQHSLDTFEVVSVEDVCNFPPCHEPIQAVPEPGISLPAPALSPLGIALITTLMGLSLVAARRRR